MKKQLGGWGGFPGGTMNENPCARAGDMGSIPDPGRSLDLHASEQLSACATTIEPRGHNY